MYIVIIFYLSERSAGLSGFGCVRRVGTFVHDEKTTAFCCASRPCAAPAGAGRQGAGRRRCEGRPETDVVQHPLLQARRRRRQRLGCAARRLSGDDPCGIARRHRLPGAAPAADRLSEGEPPRIRRGRHGTRRRDRHREETRRRRASDDHVPPFEIHPARQRVFLDQPHARMPFAGLGRHVPPRHGVGAAQGPENRKGVLLFRHPFRSYRQAGPRRIGPDDGRPDEADRR